MRMLFGGGENAADTILSQLDRNRMMLWKLEHIQEQMDTEYQSPIQDQIQLVQEEQDRLRELARQGKEDKGLLGWLFK